MQAPEPESLEHNLPEAPSEPEEPEVPQADLGSPSLPPNTGEDKSETSLETGEQTDIHRF